MSHLALGQQGENLAAEHLRGLGYSIVARNFRTRMGEIDMIALDGDTLVFVEVKTRRSARFGTGAEAVTAHKQLKIGRMAQCYLALKGNPSVRCRFDVMDIRLGLENPSIRHLIDAFCPPLG